MDTISKARSHGGIQGVYRHEAETTRCPMTFAVYLPPQAEAGKVPVLWYLSGLTCTHANVTEKGEFRRWAAELGLIIVCPDTSPRGDGVANDAGWDLGQGAGFYVDASEAPWTPHFRMWTYVTEELPALVAEHFPVDMERQGITGHSMGGHGALTLALRHPDLFRSVSAFAPICSPTRCPWGEKAFTAYLGEDRAAWDRHDAARLIEAGAARGAYDDILVDQGDADSFLTDQLKPELLRAAAEAAGQGLTLRMQPGYDHSYFFMTSFIADHIAFHAARLKA